MSTTYTAPSGPPPSSQNPTSAPNPDDDPFDPPPAYTPSASNSTGGETSLATGPNRMDFSGPPPIPERLEQNITGVGIGFGRRQQHELGSQFTGQSSPPINPQYTNQSYIPPPLPPRNPSISSNLSGHPPNKETQSGFNNNNNNNDAGPSRPPPPPTQDLSPTEIPTPGRPLLWKGHLLVYPKGFWCHKCNNTGYKSNDPSNPHETDWKKYGKPYNSALSISYLQSTRPGSNPSTISSSNFQKPLPSFSSNQPNQNIYGNLPPPPPPPGSWNSFPGNHNFRPNLHQNQMLPPPPTPLLPPPMAGQQIYVQRGPGYIPPGALVVTPGDPRIGGRPCHNCGGSGRENDFLFGFDVGRCYACQGLGRVFR